ncbi:MAG TPA: S41 family peptidase, partial [Fimbriimonas sp.]
EFEEQDLFVVDLMPQELTFGEDDLDALDEPKKEDKKEVKVEVYEPGIEYRMRRLTTNGAMGALASSDSKSIFTNVRAPGGTPQAVSVPVAGGTPTPVAAIQGAMSNAEYGKDGKKLYYTSGGRLFAYSPGSPASVPIPFSAQWTVDTKEEEMALFREIAWAMENLYYDPKLHGKDWPAIKARYEKTVPHAYDRDDFYALMGEMMEEIESSHLGADAPDAPVPGVGSDSTGMLGVEFDPKALDARASYIVSRVVPQSPASDPQSQLLVGDRILSVDGVEPGPRSPIASLLNKKAGRKVALVVDRSGKQVSIDIKPTTSAAIGNLEYEAWVAQERSLVDRYSNGRLGYTHIRSMNGPSLERFLREIHTEAEGKQGVLIDCRYNGGGSTAVDVLAVLIRQPWLVRTTRGEMGVKISENLWRSDALELPTALLVNTYSFSNAEIIAEGFRRLKRGPIVGERTPGYVIGTSGYRLWDGGMIRMPAIGAYTVEGENLENNGRRPDHVVWFDPNVWEKGEDPQVRKAVEELLRIPR